MAGRVGVGAWAACGAVALVGGWVLLLLLGRRVAVAGAWAVAWVLGDELLVWVGVWLVGGGLVLVLVLLLLVGVVLVLRRRLVSTDRVGKARGGTGPFSWGGEGGCST